MGLPPSPDIPFMLVIAVCCSTSLLNRMKPKPLLNPFSSRTTEDGGVRAGRGGLESSALQ